jgi:hypothetical protein
MISEIRNAFQGRPEAASDAHDGAAAFLSDVSID